jgi:hypothetical protein
MKCFVYLFVALDLAVEGVRDQLCRHLMNSLGQPVPKAFSLFVHYDIFEGLHVNRNLQDISAV